MSDILVIGDTHFPFIHKPTLSKILEHLEKVKKKPDYIVQIGDLYDFYSFSRFPRNQNIVTPQEEVLTGQQGAEEMWKAIKKRAPSAVCYQMRGNHCDRPMKRLKEVAPELQCLFKIDDLWKFKGVCTVLDSREELVINGIVFIHGYRSKLGDHAAYTRNKTVCGHSHRGGVIYLPKFGHKEMIWELNAGYVADPAADPLKYSQQKFNNWTHGFGIIDALGPRFVPL